MNIWTQICVIFCIFSQLYCEISNFIPTHPEIGNASSTTNNELWSNSGIQNGNLSLPTNHPVANNSSQNVLRKYKPGKDTVHKKSIFVRKRVQKLSETRKPSKTKIPSSTSEHLTVQSPITTASHLTNLSMNSENILRTTHNPLHATLPVNKLKKHITLENVNTTSVSLPSNVDDGLCPPALKATEIKWRSGSSVVLSYLPHAINTDCVVNCDTPKILHRSISIQEGDAIKMMLSPHDAKLSSTHKGPLAAARSQKSGSTLFPTSPRSPIVSTLSSSSEPNKNKSSEKFTNPLMTNNMNGNESKNASRQLSRQTPNIISPMTTDSKNSLIIWQVTEKEWQSCSTREGGQIANSGENGVAVIKSSFLIPGKAYLIGRSSWSSSECFKMKVIVRAADCGEGSICSGKGVCFANSTMNKYECSCCYGYSGAHCQERDACRKRPCKNAGICIDIEEGHDGSAFQCICAYGFRGPFCNQLSSLCTSNPCKNGGSCLGNHTSFSCICPRGWNGSQCQNISELTQVSPSNTTSTSAMNGACSDGECVHGVCIQTSNTDFRCFCQPGYGGNKCQIEYNECLSQPCMHGGSCMDNVGYFQCICMSGYTGMFCEVKEDFCQPNPCPSHLVCVQGKNSYTCECSPNLSRGCSASEDNLCTPNPCANGGSCFIVAEVMTYNCVCRSGFTGDNCKGITHSQKSPVPEYPNHIRPKNHNKEKFIFETVGKYPTLEPVEAIDPPVFLSNGHNRLRNFYTVAVMLSCAFFIVLLVVIICHIKVNGVMCSYFLPSFRRPYTPSFSRMQMTSNRDKRRKRLGALRLDLDDGASVPMTPQGRSEIMYCNVDTCDHQDVPLMKQ